MFILLQIYKTHLFRKKKVCHNPKVVEILAEQSGFRRRVGRWSQGHAGWPAAWPAKGSVLPAWWKQHSLILLWPCHSILFEAHLAIIRLYCSTQPDYQWYAPDQFPPDVQHKANGKTTAVFCILSCLHFHGIFWGCLLSIHSFVFGDGLLQSCVAYTTLIWCTWGYIEVLKKKKMLECRSAWVSALAPAPFPVSASVFHLGLETKTWSRAVGQQQGSVFLP